MNKSEKVIAYIMQQLNQIGEDFGWQIGKIGANYENGYMKCNQDSKAHFRKEKIKKDIEAIINDHSGEITEKVETNADRIRNMSDEELAVFLRETVWKDGRNMFECEDYTACCKCVSCRDCNVYGIWLKEKVK